jgi:gliding motility-associated-like protein
MNTTVLINGSPSNTYNGISWSVSGGVVTISGTPTFGTYTYEISSIPNGPTGCVATTKTGTIVSQAASLILSSAEFTNNQIICIGNSIEPIIYYYTGAISIIDLPSGVTALISTADSTFTLLGTPTEDGYFNYAISTETLCGFETLLGEITVVQSDPSMISFGGADQTISLGGSVELVTTGTSISNYNWSPSSGLSSSTISNPFASPVATTTYTVTAQDEYGCSYTDDIIVNVLTDYTLTIPSLITPNGDGSNDFWEIPESLFYPNTSVLIINREGQEVYSSSSYDNTWNGTFEGKLLPEATYYYFIQFSNSEITHKGPITILRNIK